MVTDIMENITKTSPMDPDFIVQYTDITMLGTLQTVDFKALANSLFLAVSLDDRGLKVSGAGWNASGGARCRGLCTRLAQWQRHREKLSARNL